MRRVCLAVSCIFAFTALTAQDKVDSRLKKITPADFNVSSPVVDSNANAVILADIGSTDFIGNTNGYFSLVFKQYKRVLLRNRNSFDEATIKVPVYTGATSVNEERFEDLEATTYNIENGQVIATKVDKASVFTEKLDKDHNIKKFTFPNIKEGSIIEYKYTIKSPFRHSLRTWVFQDSYPVLWSEYTVLIPHIYKYLITKVGFLPYAIDTAKKIFKNYSIIESNGTASNNVINVSGDAISATWAIKDAPAFKSEGYISSPRNVISKVKFQLKEIKYSEDDIRLVVKDWYATAGDLMKDPDFGKELTENKGWAGDLIKQANAKGTSYEQAKRIFEYIRDNFKCTDHDALWLSQPLKKTWQTKTGNVVDLNMLVTAALIEKGFVAFPVLLSTKDNGFANETSAFLSEYNYVLSKVSIENVDYLLDASQIHLGFGKLPLECYNNFGRVIDPKLPVMVGLSPDSLKETKYSNLIIINTEGAAADGAFTSNLGYLESLRLRDKLAGTKQDEYFKELKKDYTSEVSLSNLVIDSLKQLDEPVTVHYDMKLNFGGEDIIYVNPMFNEAYKKNPFAAAERLYPVEMPYKMKEVYTFNMEIPKGYKVDELPKSTRVKLNEDEGMFEYIIAKGNDNVQMRCVLSLEKAVFYPEDYETLRNFFGYVVKKQAEQIVFKKIN